MVPADPFNTTDMDIIQAVINGIADIVCIFTPDNILINCNRNGHAFFELSTIEVNTISREELLYSSVLKTDDTIVSHIDTNEYTDEIRWFPDKEHYIRSHRSAIPDKHGNTLYIIEQLTDITEQVHRDQTQDGLLRSFAENVPFGYLIIQNGYMRFANTQFCNQFRIQRTSVEGAAVDTFLSLIHSDDRPALETILSNTSDILAHSEKHIVRPMASGYDQECFEVIISKHVYRDAPSYQVIIIDNTISSSSDKTLYNSDNLLEAVFQAIPDPVFAKDPSFKYTHVNPAIESILHKTSSDIIGHTDKDLFGSFDAERTQETDKLVLAGLVSNTEETYLIDGKKRIYQVIKVPIHGNNDTIIGLCGVARDITVYKETMAALKQSQKEYKRIFDGFRDIYYETNLEGIILEISPSVESFSKYRRKDLINTPVINLYKDPEERDIFLKILQTQGRVDDYELTILDADGVGIECSANCVISPEPDGTGMRIIGSIRNISSMKRVERALSKSLREKEILLREIHHRLKNNMQVISGLLTLQAQRTNNQTYQQLLTESISRVNTMSLIHESLYRSSNLAEIDMRQYLDNLIRNLFTLYHGESDKVSSYIDTDDITLTMDKAIPCGLIINELVSNALKHGFADNDEGSILLIMSQTPNNTINLMISHTGKGFDKSFDWRSLSSLGLQLVTMLTEHQLGGTIELTAPERSEFTITFQR